MSDHLTFPVILMAAAVAIGLWRLFRLFRYGKADVLFNVKRGPSSVSREHPFFWAHVFVLIVVTAGSIALLAHFWGIGNSPK